MTSPAPNGSFSTRFGGNQSGSISIDTSAGDWVYLSVAAETVSISAPGCFAVGVTSPNLTWYRRGGAASGGGIGAGVDCWAAFSPTALTGENVSTLLNNSIDDAIIVVACFSGATGFDTNAGIPATAGIATNAWPTTTFDTTKADCTLIGSSGGVNGPAGAPSGWTAYVGEGNGGGVVGIAGGIQYQQVSVAQSGATWQPTSSPGGNGGGAVVDALTSDTLPTPPAYPTMIAMETSGGADGTSHVDLTTAAAAHILVAVSNSAGMTVTGVSGATLGAFSKRGAIMASDNKAAAELWEIAASGALSAETITVTTSGSDNFIITGMGFAGSTGFDTNGSLPATASALASGAPSLAYSTTASAGLAIAVATGGNYVNGNVWNIAPGAPPPGSALILANIFDFRATLTYGAVYMQPLDGAQSGAAFPLTPADTTRSTFALLVDVLAAAPTSTVADYTLGGNVSVSDPTWAGEVAATVDYAPGNVSVESGNWTASAVRLAPYSLGNVTATGPLFTGGSPGVASYAPGSVAVSGPEWIGPANAKTAELDVAVIGQPVTNARAAELDVAAVGLPISVARSAELDVAVLAPPTGTTHGGVAELDVAVLVYVGPCSTRRCQVWKITRKDGEVLAFTSLDVDISWMGTTYRTCDSLVASAAESNSELRSVGNQELTGIISDAGISPADLYAGLYDDAFVEVWVIPWDGQPDDQAPFRIAAGWTGKVVREEAAFTAEILGPSARLQQTALVDFFTPGCRFDFGVNNGVDSLCPVDAEALKVAAVPVTGQQLRTLVMFDAAMPGGIALWNYGTVRWLTGQNAGVECEVDTVDWGAQTLSLWDLAPYPPAVGDTFDLLPGCPKTGDACKNYGVFISFGGFPDVPGPDALQSNADSLFTGNG